MCSDNSMRRALYCFNFVQSDDLRADPPGSTRFADWNGEGAMIGWFAADSRCK